MIDLIERRAALDVMNGHFETLKQAWGSMIKKDEVAVAMYIDMRSIIEALPSAQPEPRWIPCSERLPEANGNYLVTGRQGAVNKRKFEDGRWYGNWAVTAWMPLPKPYGGDEE